MNSETALQTLNAQCANLLVVVEMCSGSSANVSAGLPAFRTSTSFLLHHINGKMAFLREGLISYHHDNL